MIHEIGRELESRLRAKGCPFPVVDRETDKPVGWRERIVIEHDGNDSFGPVRSQHTNPKHRATRRIGGKITIYARSPAANATAWEHRRRAEAALDLVICAMAYIAADRKNAWAPTGGAFVAPADETSADAPGGAAYELRFTFDRPVPDWTWGKAIAPEATIAGFTNTTKVSACGADDDNDPTTVPVQAETACGT